MLPDLRAAPKQITEDIVTPAEAGVQGNRCGLPFLDSRFRGNDDDVQ
jgi:hypothetical protein